MSEEQEAKVSLNTVKPWTRSASLAVEKEVLGFYLSDHPLKGFESLASVWVTGSVADLSRIGREHAEKQPKDEAPKRYDPRNRDAGKKRVIVAGLITEIRELITKKGTRMAFAKIEDLTGVCELVIFPDAFAKFETLLKDERPMLIAGLLEVSEENVPKMILDNISPLEEILKKTKKMTFRLDRLKSDQYSELYAVLANSPGPTKVDFRLFLEDLNQDVVLEAEGLEGVMISNELLENIHSHFGTTNFIEVKTS